MRRKQEIDLKKQARLIDENFEKMEATLKDLSYENYKKF